ncbi:hypothetical protein JNB_05405 [Janibacter sp. HTCC2649]|uniref:hypothetical protein n=1 Tax=Janibacter sp. HTCC2649 TaxID=313589 RepID=UPI000066ECCD|nr:hypothetical protein [Janibacter sp. HTCC2649]EAP99583.1 hypothetical protein JNB_05405 [Janibacter sp. HTCC2649]
MDLTTARQAAQVRGVASFWAAGLCGLIAVGCALFARTAPAEVQGLLVGAAVLALVAALACAAVATANRALRRDPVARGPLAQSRTALVVTVVAWVAVVVFVTLASGETAWFIASLGLASLILPVALVAGLTLKGPHPSDGGEP